MISLIVAQGCRIKLQKMLISTILLISINIFLLLTYFPFISFTNVSIKILASRYFNNDADCPAQNALKSGFELAVAGYAFNKPINLLCSG